MPSSISKKNCIPILFAILVILSNCKEKTNTILISKPPISFSSIAKQSTEIDTKFIAEVIKADDASIGFYRGIITLYGKAYFVYLGRKDSLTFIQLADKSVKKICIDSIVKKLDEYTVGNLENNQILFLNNEQKVFFQYSINEDFSIGYIRKIQLNSTGAIKKTNFNVSPDATRFVMIDSLLFLNYSKSGSENFIDKTALMYFNIKSPQPDPTFAIEYPKKYHERRIYCRDLLFSAINDSSLVFAFFQSDDLGIFNIKSNTVTQTSINRREGYLAFDKKKERNLGYTAKYLQTNETNYKLLSDSLQCIYLFKRLAKAQKIDTTVMECYVFDAQLNPIHYFKLNQEVCPSYIYKYQKGFLAFTKDLTKAYYYAF
jgi:hypothetical protein